MVIRGKGERVMQDNEAHRLTFILAKSINCFSKSNLLLLTLRFTTMNKKFHVMTGTKKNRRGSSQIGSKRKKVSNTDA